MADGFSSSTRLMNPCPRACGGSDVALGRESTQRLGLEPDMFEVLSIISVNRTPTSASSLGDTMSDKVGYICFLIICIYKSQVHRHLHYYILSENGYMREKYLGCGGEACVCGQSTAHLDVERCTASPPYSRVKFPIRV
jgi:hypothetical protein